MTKTLRTGILLALGTAAISGVSNFVAKLSVTVVKNATVFTFLKNAIVGLLIIGLVVLFVKWKELRELKRTDWYKLIAIAVVGGSVPFLLFFNGLTQTTAVHASVIHKTLFVWVAVLAWFSLKEKFLYWHGVAIALLLGGTFALGGLNNFHMGKGEWMVLGATLLWAVENVIAKKALANLSTLTVVAARMFLGSLVLLGVVIAQGKLSMVSALNFTQWGWVVLPSLLLFGYVLTWYSALKRAPASLVASLLVPATFITALLSGTFHKAPMTGKQWFSGALVTAGVALFIWATRRAANVTVQPNAQPATTRRDA
ncbi:MAG: DMT family transporter [Patescibacteria group bacterium]